MMSADRLPIRQMMTIEAKITPPMWSEQYFSGLSDEGLVRGHLVERNEI